MSTEVLVPFLLRNAEPGITGLEALCNQDTPTGDDPVPAVLDVNSGGFALARKTFVTDVRSETCDEN